MKEHNNTDHDYETRQRFAEQTAKFWEECKKKDEGDWLRVEEARTDVYLQDDRSKATSQ
jgi:NAD dependent epimerase/dehydratase family enzyme